MIVNSYIRDEERSDRLVEDLEGIFHAIDRLIGGPLRRELVVNLSLEELLDLKRKKRDREVPVVIEKKPFYVIQEDDDSPSVAEWGEEERKITLRLSEGERRAPFSDVMHEIGHGIYRALSMEHVVKFAEIYYRLLNKYISRVSSGYDHLIAAERICSQQFFLKDVDPKEPGLICWDSVVHQDYEPFDSDKRDLFHRRRKIPRVRAHRLLLDPEEAFAEFFSYYHGLRRRPKPYKITPAKQVPKRKKIQKDLYEFGQKYMRHIISSARPTNRNARKLRV